MDRSSPRPPDLRLRQPRAFFVLTPHRAKRLGFAIRYSYVEFYASARKHGIAEDDAVHAIEHALVAAEDDEGKCLYLGPDRAGNMLEVVSVQREDDSEVVIHAMRMRRIYESWLRDIGDADG